MTTLTEKQLAQSRDNGTTVNSIYTVAASTTIGISVVNLCNTTTSNATVRLFFVPSGGSADQTTAMLYDFIIPANDYHSFSPEKMHYLETGGTIQYQNGTANALTITVSGVEIV